MEDKKLQKVEMSLTPEPNNPEPTNPSPINLNDDGDDPTIIVDDPNTGGGTGSQGGDGK